ncbi:hypothetical protein [Mesorhizobium sp. NPDC059025]|uniref:hypothetical protein n=1 Tax=unclassified Mesorhizobium TaxID=325217 RepID=UPI00366EE4EF
MKIYISGFVLWKFIALISAIFVFNFINAANASSLYDEFIKNRKNFLIVPNLIPSQQMWRQGNHERLMSMIEGAWLDASARAPGSEVDFKKNCSDFGGLFKRINGYSFEMIFKDSLRKSKSDIRVIYIFKDGFAYNVRYDVEKQIEMFGELQAKDFFRRANQTSILILMSPNALLEINAETGFPTLWSRCLPS